MSEDQNDMLGSSKVIVIHPGSLYLRLGHITDQSPTKVLHAIARRRRTGGKSHQDHLLVQQARLDTRAWNTVDDASLQVFQALSRVPLKDGSRRETPDPSRVLELNNSIQPELLDIKTEEEAKDFEDVIVGDSILDIPNSLPYNTHFPMRRGDLNLHSGVGGSTTSILVDLQEIWTRTIEKHLGILPCDLKHYRAVLVIPALYKRSLIKHYINLLLLNMGFNACFVVQDHVAATFGSGLAIACVVDVGDQKTSISCVEDGISQPSSRILLGYGGADITQVLYFLSRKTGFPYKKCNPGDQTDGLLLHSIKEDNCHFNLEDASLFRHLFNVKKPEMSPCRYSLYLGDERIVAPLAFFQIELLEVTGRKEANVIRKDPGDPEDPHDHLYLRETSRKYTKTGDIQPGSEPGGQDAEFEEVDLEGVAGPDIGTEVLPLDQAICRSIDTCLGEEMKRKMFGSVLVVGGGFRFSGAAQYLQTRLATSLGQTSNTPVEVLIDVKDSESDTTTWKGAAVMASMESAQELWLRPKEWSKQGQKLLRERAPFPWA